MALLQRSRENSVSIAKIVAVLLETAVAGFVLARLAMPYSIAALSATCARPATPRSTPEDPTPMPTRRCGSGSCRSSTCSMADPTTRTTPPPPSTSFSSSQLLSALLSDVMARVEEECSLADERVEEMVAFNGSQQTIKRKGLFLKPSSSNLNSHNPSPPPCYEPMSSRIKEAPRPELRWWADPQEQWGNWVKKLRPNYMNLWKTVGIFDAIMVSIYKFRRDPCSLWGAVSFWGAETSCRGFCVIERATKFGEFILNWEI